MDKASKRPGAMSIRRVSVPHLGAVCEFAWFRRMVSGDRQFVGCVCHNSWTTKTKAFKRVPDAAA